MEETAIYLRPMTMEDAPLIVKWRNLPSVRSRFIYQKDFTLEGQQIWMDTMIKTGRVVQMMICLKHSHEPIGSVYIRDIDHTHHKGEYGIFIGEESARGCGVGTDACRLMMEYGFQELKLHKLYLRVFADNPGAYRSYEKAGFVQEGYLKDEVCIDGVYRDMLWMAAICPAQS